MWYCFSLRYKVVFPMPSIPAAESLSPPVSRRLRRIARRSSSSRGRISSFSGTLPVDRPRPESDGARDGVFQFTQVARAIVGDQARHGVFGDGAHRATRIGKFLEKGGHQNGDIALALAQWRQLDLHDV